MASEEKEVAVVTYRGIFQEVEEALGIHGDRYREESAVVELDGGDAKELGVEAGRRLHAETGSGEVVVVAKVSEEPHPGIAFMPASPWSAQLLSGEVGEDGILKLKRFVARISASDEEVTTLEEITERIGSS
ncbi:molybdopterin dinucleotide binding domain-containing protein [Methanocrinis sp.]|uniref:molybdopterin dinucleotide binding domain-containing protein n=1 Tax=Methanocrinis sp. TaxID=3101522 RepID=UPI003D0B4BB3